MSTFQLTENQQKLINKFNMVAANNGGYYYTQESLIDDAHNRLVNVIKKSVDKDPTAKNIVINGMEMVYSEVLQLAYGANYKTGSTVIRYFPFGTEFGEYIERDAEEYLENILEKSIPATKASELIPLPARQRKAM